MRKFAFWQNGFHETLMFHFISTGDSSHRKACFKFIRMSVQDQNLFKSVARTLIQQRFQNFDEQRRLKIDLPSKALASCT